MNKLMKKEEKTEYKKLENLIRRKKMLRPKRKI